MIFSKGLQTECEWILLTVYQGYCIINMSSVERNAFHQIYSVFLAFALKNRLGNFAPLSAHLRCGGGDSAQLELPFCQFFPSSSFRPGRKEHLVRPSFEVAFYNIWSKLFMDNCYVNHLKLEFVNLWSLHLWKKIYILFEYPLLSINLTLAWSQQNQVSKLLYFIDCAKALHSLSLPKAVGSQPSRGRTINPRPS